MSIRAISSTINASFIRSFQGLAGGDGPSIGAGAGKGATIYSGLRLGARTFASSIQSLNSAVGFVNIAENTLKKLSVVVDDMIGLAEKATSVSAGTETRRKLQADFNDLADKFREVVSGSKINDIDYLTEEGLATLFQRVGLDQESSEGVASVLAQFIKPATEDSFASEETKGERPVSVPILRKSKAEQVSTQSATTDNFGISPDYAVFEDGTTNINKSIDLLGNQQALVNSGDIILAVNESRGDSVGETTGYSIIQSDANYLAANPDLVNQLYLVAPDSTIVRQITNEGSNYNFISADISADNKTVAFSRDDGVVAIYQVDDISDLPPDYTELDAWSGNYDVVSLSNDATHILRKEAVSGDLSIDEIGVSNEIIPISNPSFFGFISEQTALVVDSTGTEVYTYTMGGSPQLIFETASPILTAAFLQPDSRYTVNDGSVAGRPEISAFAFVTTDGQTNQLTVLNYDLNADSLKTRYRRDLGQGTVDSISLSYQNDLNTSKDRIDVGVKGTLPALFSDSDREVYRIKEAKFATNNSLFSPASSEPAKILDGNLFSRADSYRMLADLKALRDQISDNVDALDNARQYISNNINLVRTAGFAFLNVSDQLSGSEEAEEVAKLVAAEIRRNANTAQAAQVENLSNIVSQTTALLSNNS
jgi:hypothetical protein